MSLCDPTDPMVQLFKSNWAKIKLTKCPCGKERLDPFISCECQNVKK